MNYIELAIKTKTDLKKKHFLNFGVGLFDPLTVTIQGQFFWRSMTTEDPYVNFLVLFYLLTKLASWS